MLLNPLLCSFKENSHLNKQWNVAKQEITDLTIFYLWLNLIMANVYENFRNTLLQLYTNSNFKVFSF